MPSDRTAGPEDAQIKARETSTGSLLASANHKRGEEERIAAASGRMCVKIGASGEGMAPFFPARAERAPWLTALWLLPLVVASASQSSAGDGKEQSKASATATRSRRGAMEDLQSQIRWEYGGWRPIMPGSPFFFVKTSRAVSLDGSASALTPVRMRAPQLHNSIHKDDSKEDLKAEASSASERMAESQSFTRHVPMGAPTVGSGAGCCDFQPVLYVKHQSNSYQQAKGSSPAWQATKPETNLAGDDDEGYQKDTGKPEDDLKSSGSQIVHGSPIGDERPQLPHQLLQDGQDAQSSHSSSVGLESVLSKLPLSIHPVLQGQGEHIMSALSGLDGSIQPANIEQLLQHVHASGGVAPDIERLIATMVNSAHGGQDHGPGLQGPNAHQDSSVPNLPPGVPLAHPGPGGQYGEHPKAPPYHPRPDKNIFRWYPKPRATAPPPHKPTYIEMPKKPGDMNSKQQNSQGKSYGGGGLTEQMLVQNALHAMQNTTVLTTYHSTGPLQQLEAPPLAHHYGGLDGDVAHADSQQHFVTARPHDPPNFDRQTPRRPPPQLLPLPPPPPPQHLQQRPPPEKQPDQHQPHQQLQQHHQEYQPQHHQQHHQQHQQHSVPYPGYQEHTISAEIVRGRPQGDYDPRQPPRIHVEDVPADVLATGIHPSGHPIRVDGINLNIIAPSPHEQPPFPPRHAQTTASPSPAPVFTHYHRPEDVASAPFFQHQHHQDTSQDTHQHHNYNATADATGNKEHYYDHPSYNHDDRKQDNRSHGRSRLPRKPEGGTLPRQGSGGRQ
ncbi:hypothetical protein HPB51_007050 [Rhipicephalus microplus]|uniref:Uncharacterized protein n=1 Tax=Rhipicephalus microplus TaxID=6941 RepID=A0A9J6DTQ7_RHIMP|nr:hypothetical protein HPB51_007050 [Rhipicephalus microplus]